MAEYFNLSGLAGRETPLGAVPKQLRPIFRDREDFSAGSSFNAETVGKLDASAALILLCSPASAKSAAVNEEIRLFKARHPDRPLIPLILAGKPYDEAQECFAPELNASAAGRAESAMLSPPRSCFWRAAEGTSAGGRTGRAASSSTPRQRAGAICRKSAPLQAL